MLLKIKILFLVIFVWISNAWGQCDLTLGSPSVNPVPMSYKGESTISYYIAEQGGRDILQNDLNGNPTCIFDIILSKIAPKDLDLNLITGAVNTYFNLSWDALSNTIRLIQKADIPADTEFNVEMPMDIIGQSDIGNPLNGFEMNATNGITYISEYTYTYPSTLIANDDTVSINGNIGGMAIANITANDTINTEPVILGVDTEIVEINNTTPLDINQTTGAVSVPAGTATGIYEATYTVCEVFEGQSSSPTNCHDASITISVDTTTSTDYSIKIKLTGASTVGLDTIVPAIITIAELSGGENISKIMIRIPKHDYILLDYNSSMTVLDGIFVQNVDFELLDHPSEYRFVYIGNMSSEFGHFPVNNAVKFGINLSVKPISGTSGQIDFTTNIKPGNGDDNPANDQDSAQIDYTN